MKAIKFKIGMLLMIAALLVSVPAIARADSYDKGQQNKNSKTGNMESKRQELFKDLNLTAEQKKMLEENKKARKEEMKALFSQIKEKRDAIRNELQKTELNIGKITQINNELKILDAQMLDHRLDGILSVRKILSPEQFKKFMEKMGQRHERFGEKKD